MYRQENKGIKHRIREVTRARGQLTPCEFEAGAASECDSSASKTARRLADHSEESEKAVERYLCNRARAAGWIALKYYNPFKAGFPDRVLIGPGGAVAWVELKSRGCRPSPLQALRFSAMERMGHQVHVLDSRAKVDRFISIITRGHEV